MDTPEEARVEERSSHFTRELGRAVTFLSRSRKRFMNERLRDYGFSGAMYMILLHIERHPGTTQDSIANHMFIDKCNVARRTKKLEALGYLYRETNQNDRRQNNLYLTSPRRAGSWCPSSALTWASGAGKSPRASPTRSAQPS